MLLIGLFGLSCDADVTRSATSPAVHALSSTPFSSRLSAYSFNVRHDCKVSACGRYTINCGIPPIQNIQIDHAEVARCTLSISSLTDLEYCVVFVN